MESFSNSNPCSSLSRSGDLVAKIVTCFGANLCGRSGRDNEPRLLQTDTNFATMLR
jgi:hypothetical protein